MACAEAMSRRSGGDTDLAREVQSWIVRGDDVSALFASADPPPPAEWREAALLFQSIVHSVRSVYRLFGDLCEEETQRNIGDEEARKLRPRQGWNFVGALFIGGPAGLSAVAANLYESAILSARVAEGKAGIPEGSLHEGVQYNNLGVDCSPRAGRPEGGDSPAVWDC